MLYPPYFDWVRGGQFERMREEVVAFVNRFTSAGFTLWWALLAPAPHRVADSDRPRSVMFDGAVEKSKLAVRAGCVSFELGPLTRVQTWVARRKGEVRKVQHIFDHGTPPGPPPACSL